MLIDFAHITHSQPIIETLAAAKSKTELTGRKRYFLNDDDILTDYKGTQYVISNQWGKDNIEDMIDLANTTLGYQIEKM